MLITPPAPLSRILALELCLMNPKQENPQDENRQLDNSKLSRIKVPTSLKRTSPCFNNNSKIRKVGQKPELKCIEPRPKEASNMQGTTFTIPRKPTPAIEKPTLRAPRRAISVTRSSINKTVNTTAPTGVKPRPAWDLRGRLTDLERAYNEKNTETTQKITELEEECARLKAAASENENKINELSAANESLTSQNKELTTFLSIARQECADLTQFVNQLSEKNLCLNSTVADLKIENEELKTALSETQEKLSCLQALHALLTKERAELQCVLDNRNEVVTQKEAEVSRLASQLETKSLELIETAALFRESEAKLGDVSSELENTRNQLTKLTESFKSLSTLLEEKCCSVTELHVELNNLKNDRDKLLFSLDSGKDTIGNVLAENERLSELHLKDIKSISELKASLSEATTSRDTFASDLGISGNELIQLRVEVAKYRSELAHADCDRRLMHHQIMELRGTIRVCCRMRPVLTDERDAVCYSVEYRENTSVTMSSAEGRETVTGNRVDSNRHEFTFDHVLGAEASQQSVFEEIDPLVQSALDGYSVCIFAYGQTGSGKTYTMEGELDPPERAGLIKRAVDRIFGSIPLMSNKGWGYTITASFVEIYNENLRDLLVGGDGSIQNSKLEIKILDARTKKEARKNGVGQVADVFVPNLTAVSVTSASEVKRLLQTANRNRTVAATKCNEFSSRSHSVFRLQLVGCNAVLKQTSQATINLVDLAGSERLDQSQAEGERMRETQCINKSLSCLRTVITSLQKKDSHVPFRDSKLTHLLQSSLGGNCKTLMIVNISPLQDHFSESLCSLRFAANVNKCFIGTATQKKSSLAKD